MEDSAIASFGLEEIVIPTGRAMVKYLQNRRNGAKLEDIFKFLGSRYPNIIDEVKTGVKSMIDVCTKSGFLELRGASYMIPKRKRRINALRVRRSTRSTSYGQRKTRSTRGSRRPRRSMSNKRSRRRR